MSSRTYYLLKVVFSSDLKSLNMLSDYLKLTYITDQN